MLEPLQLRTRTNEELHLHLLKLAHTEDKLTRYNLITEGLTDLCDTERYLHTAGFLYVEEVDKDTLCGLRTQIDLHRAISSTTHLGREHEVKLTNIGPVTRTADRANNLFVKDDLLELLEVIVVHCFGKTLVQRLALRNMLFHALVGSFEHLFVKTLPKTLAGFLYFLSNFLVVLGNLIFDQHIRAITLLRVPVVDQRIIERIDMTGGFPCRRVHEDSGIDTDDVLMQQGHRIPPITLDIVLQLYAVLTIVIHCAETVIDLAGRKNETVLLAMRDDFLKCFFLCLLCHKAILF